MKTFKKNKTVKNVKAYFKKGNNMKKAILCLAAAFAIATSAYFVAQHANGNSVSAHACNSKDCE